MLNGMNIAIIGGDTRQLSVVQTLSELGAKIILVGFGQLDRFFSGTKKMNLADVDFSQFDAIILPVSGIAKNGKVEALFSCEEIFLTTEMVEKTKENVLFYSGISGASGADIIEQQGRKNIKLMEHKELSIYNSVPTAEGVLLLVLQNTDFTVHNANVTVLGYGNCGMTIAHMFKQLGAKVKVAVNCEADFARLFAEGITSFHIDDFSEESYNVDVCINTIPSLVVTKNVILSMPLHTFILDIATNGGTDFEFAKKRGVKALLAPGLPAMVAPKTAGAIYAKLLAKLLYKQWKVV